MLNESFQDADVPLLLQRETRQQSWLLCTMLYLHDMLPLLELKLQYMQSNHCTSKLQQHNRGENVPLEGVLPHRTI